VQELLAGTFAKSKRQRTALHVAARAGHERVVAQLLAAGAPVHVCDTFGCTPLWTAAVNGHKLVVQQLLEAGAAADAGSVQALQREGWTVLHTAAAAAAAAEEEEEQEQEQEEEEDSANSVAVLQLLLDAGMEVNTGAGSMAGTALHRAASSGSVPAVKALLAAGADVNAVDSDRTTPLHKAAASGRASVVAVLIDAGAKVNAIDREGDTALCVAVASARNSCSVAGIKLLVLEAGACCTAPGLHLWALGMAASGTASAWRYGYPGQAELDCIVDYLTSRPTSAKALVVAALAAASVLTHNQTIWIRPAGIQRQHGERSVVRKLLVAAVQNDAAAAQAALQQYTQWVGSMFWHEATWALVTAALTEALLKATVAAAAVDWDAHHTAVQHLLVNVAALHDQQQQQQQQQRDECS